MEAEPNLPLGDRRVTLEHLRAFVLIAEGGGFHRAGSELHRSQSAVTQSLKKLEDILGCRLIERRQGHIVGLTHDGERFLPSASEILARMSEAVSAMRQPQIEGRIALGVPDDFKIADLHGVISRCAAMNKSLRIEVTSALSSHLGCLMRRGSIDLAILKRVASTNVDDIGTRSTVLRSEPLHWVYNRHMEFVERDELPLVLFPEGCSYRSAAAAALHRIGKRSYEAYVSASYENIRAAVTAGLGIGILPKSALAKDHKILGRQLGFPALPDVQLTLVQNSADKTMERFAELLRSSPSIRLQPIQRAS